MQYNITIRQKNKGWQYIISYKDEDGEWKQRSKQGFKGSREAKAAAQKAVRELEKEFSLNTRLNKEHEGKTFKEFTTMYINHIKLYKAANTAIGYSSVFKDFSGLDNIEMRKIDSADIQGCVDKLTESGRLSNDTLKQYINKLHTAFNYAIKALKMVPTNPVIDIDIKESKTKNEKKALTQSQLNDLLSKLKNQRYYLISLIAAKCGLRIGEILGLTWDDIDDKECIINVRRQWKKKKKDGKEEDYEYGFGELKSKKSYRKVPIPPAVMCELEKFREEYPITYNKRIFNYKNVVAISSDLRQKYLKAGYDISIHELRHTYATTLIANGLDFKTTAQLMGHDVMQTMKTYSHVNDDMMEVAMDLIKKIF